MKMRLYSSITIAMAGVALACTQTESRYESCRRAAEDYCLWVAEPANAESINMGIWPIRDQIEKLKNKQRLTILDKRQLDMYEFFISTCVPLHAYECLKGSRVQ